MPDKIDHKPKFVMGGKAWYYEYPGAIDVVVPSSVPATLDCRFVRISRRTLEKSLARMKSSRNAR